MIGDTIAIVGLVALAGFIAWEGWRRRRPAPALSREEMARGFTPGARAAERLLIALGLVMALVAAALFAEPPAPPFQGRSAMLGELLHRTFGPLGIPCAIAASSVMAIAVAGSLRRRRQASRRP